MENTKKGYAPGPLIVTTICGASGGDFGTEGTFKISSPRGTLAQVNHLCAAAPELLAALEQIRRDYDTTIGDKSTGGIAERANDFARSVSATYQKITAAIAKAKGE